MSALALKALEIAATQLGVVEVPSNRGPQVEQYLHSVDLGPGYSWCAAFVYWDYQQAAHALKVPNPLYKTAGVLDHWEHTKGQKAKLPIKGDIFIMDFGGGHGHTGLVKEVLPGNKFSTIEGNSNSQGSRTGGMVCSNERPISSCIGFIRY